jgi:hypothetical protein
MWDQRLIFVPEARLILVSTQETTMTPETLALTIQAVAGAVREVCAFLQTPQGQKQVEVWIGNEQKFRDDCARFGEWLAALFKREP